MTLLFFKVFSMKQFSKHLFWQIQNGIFAYVNCFFW
ncbi:unnamed protein product [Acanthoscelides obtectus]|uniref:Uncharacterized protein n=1 Tax=Acanthoscelides obtectus TaxID=200917 RepID=A0A9P0Q6U9_ACAOB|nr:unnamed protein product [Acanthoscelides obtectus]CAK1642472.1 hypothetical protein AOBTE_LOCUS13046 [Acanthoscelides obtectus]